MDRELETLAEGNANLDESQAAEDEEKVLSVLRRKRLFFIPIFEAKK